MNPLIFDIQRSSISDGPGLRTTVFFKGCNLDCEWCHNPESKKNKVQVAYFSQNCVGCGVCKEICKGDGKCSLCGECAIYCAYGARKIYGKEYSVDEIFDIIKKDKPYYDASGGGVTFSGGECMLYPDFVSHLAQKCKEYGISVAIDTAGCVSYTAFEKVLPFVDTILYDIKCVSEELHLRYTKKSNALILENFEKLVKTDKKIIVRVPCVPYFNGGDEMEKIKNYLARFHDIEVEYLPYHDMGEGKLRALKMGEKSVL